jgi:hypothetical protein
MGQVPRAALFYGVRIDEVSAPDEVDELMEITSKPNAVSAFLLRKAGYETDDAQRYNWENELAEKTGIVVVDLDNDGLYLAVHDTVHENGGWNGAQKIDIRPLGVEEVLTLEAYARHLGVHTKLGDWFFWSDFK